MEGLPKNEVFPTKEEILIRLRSEGLIDELLQDIIRWREVRESEVVTPRDSVILNVEMLEFYSAAGNYSDAYEDAIQTLYSARATEGCDDLVEKILSIYPELDSEISVDQVDKTQENN